MYIKLKKIAIIFLVIFLILGAVSFFINDTLFALPVLVLLGSVVGFYTGVMYTFSVAFKILYILGGILSFCCIIYGYRVLNKNIYIFVFGVLLWAFLGFIGLGTSI